MKRSINSLVFLRCFWISLAFCHATSDLIITSDTARSWCNDFFFLISAFQNRHSGNVIAVWEKGFVYSNIFFGTCVLYRSSKSRIVFFRLCPFTQSLFFYFDGSTVNFIHEINFLCHFAGTNRNSLFTFEIY